MNKRVLKYWLWGVAFFCAVPIVFGSMMALHLFSLEIALIVTIAASGFYFMEEIKQCDRFWDIEFRRQRMEQP